jgi:hypothetical protein
MEEEQKLKKFIDYNNSILNYDEKISSLNKSLEPTEGSGYLVDYDEFYKLKKLLNYNHYKTHRKFSNQAKINSLFNSNNFDKIQRLKAIETRSTYYIKNIIININCVLITEELFNLISITKEKPITFIVQKNDLTLILKNGQQLELKHKNLVLDNFSFDKNDQDYDEIKNIYDSMKKYFNCENQIISQLNQNKKKSCYGFLIRNSWLNEWKKYTNYDYFKGKYLHKNESYNKELEKSVFTFKKLLSNLIFEIVYYSVILLLNYHK